MRIFKLCLVSVLCGLSISCTQLDNYMLGKENLPKPKKLDEIKSKVKMSNEWTVDAIKKNKSAAYLKLKPVISNNIIYIADAAGVIKALDKKDGHTIWSTKIDNNIISGPSVASNYIAVNTDAATVVLLNKTSGHVLWTETLSEDSLSKAVILKDRVIVKTIDGNLYAFDILTGKKLWLAEHGSPSLILKASSSPVVYGNLILVGHSDGKLDAIDVNDGRVIWQRSIAYASGSSDVERLIDIDADPIVHDNKVYVASYQGYIGGLSLTTGQFIWNKPGSVYKDMVLVNGVLYIVDSKDIIWAFEEGTGRVIWKQSALLHHGLTEPVLMGNKLIVGDKMGYLYVASINNGDLIGKIEIGSAINISPVVENNIVYTINRNGYLNATKIS